MTYKVFVDTNIILDILLKREPFLENSKQIVVKMAEDQFIPYISSSSITDLYYICRKAGIEKQFFLNYLRDLLAMFEVLIIDKVSLNDAISSDIKDFEDAVQILACKREHIDLIITRDKKDFKNPWIKVQTPDEFLPSSLE